MVEYDGKDDGKIRRACFATLVTHAFLHILIILVRLLNRWGTSSSTKQKIEARITFAFSPFSPLSPAVPANLARHPFIGYLRAPTES